MTDKNLQWEPTGLERFGHLEDKIYRVVESFKAVRKENATLQSENQKLKDEVEALRKREAGYNSNLAELQKEREQLRQRVENALNLLTSLEETQ